MFKDNKVAQSLGNTKQGGVTMFNKLAKGSKMIGRNVTRNTKVAKKVKDIKREREVAKIIKEYESKEIGVNPKEEWAKNKIAKIDKIIDALKKEKSSIEESDTIKSVTSNDETKAKILDDITTYDWAGIKKAEKVLEEGEKKTVEFNDLAEMIDLEGREVFSQEFDNIMSDDDVTIVFRETRDSR